MVLVEHPGFLRAFTSPRITESDLADGQVEVKLPRPAEINIDVTRGTTTEPETLDFREMSLQIYNNAAAIESTGTECIKMTHRDLAPGKYDLGLLAAPDLAFAREWDATQYSDYTVPALQLNSGETTTVAMQFKPLPVSNLRGDRSAEITLASATGRKLEGLPWKVSCDYEMFRNIPVAKGVVGADAVVKLAGLKAGGRYPFYRLALGDNILNTYFTAKEDQDVFRVTRMVPPAKGDKAPDMELIDVATSQPVRLSSFAGKVLLIDFWATWCGPCQPSMEKLEQLARERRDEWSGKVVILAISVDDDIPTVREHLTKRNWGKDQVTHLWYGPGEPSARGGPFGVTGIPTTVLVGNDGHVVEPNTSVSGIEPRVYGLLSKD